MNERNIKKTYIVLLVIITALALSGCGKDDKYVQVVKEGTMYMAPNIKIGKAFDKFFKSSEWKSFVSTDNRRVVEFHGDFKWKDKPAKLGIQFVIHPDNTFEMGAMTVNDVNMNTNDSASILHKVLLGN